MNLKNLLFNGYEMEITIRILFSIFITLFILKKSYKKKHLSFSGSLTAFFVGTIVTFSSFCHFASLISFFYFSNKATRFRQEIKKRYEEDFKEGGQRTAVQVFSNGFFATLFSIIYISDCGFGERPIDFLNDYKPSWLTVAILASLACCCGDTFSSELGTAFASNKNLVFHIIQFRKVPKGTNGGVTLTGSLASILGGSLVGLAYYTCLRICFFIQVMTTNVRFNNIAPQWPIILIGALSGFFGSLVDSLLGGYFQYSGRFN